MDARLVTFKPDGERIDVRLVKPITVIGRAEDCDLELLLQGVSRHHCEIRLNESAVKVKDLGSSNGTYVNDRRITESDMSAGDELRVGRVVFTVQVDGVPERIAPAKARANKGASDRSGESDGSKSGAVETEALDETDVLSHLAEVAEQHDQEEESIIALRDMAPENRNRK